MLEGLVDVVGGGLCSEGEPCEVMWRQIGSTPHHDGQIWLKMKMAMEYRRQRRLGMRMGEE